MVGGVSGDPWSQKWFVLWMVLSEGLYDGSMVEIGESRGDINRENGVVGAVVEEGLAEFVELFGASWSANCILVWFECCGNVGCDLLGDGAGDDPA